MNPGDAPVRHYTPQHRIVSWISRNVFDHVTYTVRRGLLKGMKRRGGLAWLPEFGDGGLTAEHRFLLDLDLAGKVVYDIGAFEGLLTLFFARRAAHVVAFEPNPRNYGRVLENLRVNGLGNVTVRNFGLAAEETTATMIWDPSMAGGSTLVGSGMDRGIATLAEARREKIRLTTLDADVRAADLPLPDFIKIDVEGYELPVLQGGRELLERCHPELYLEIHGETMNEKRRNACAIVEFVLARGYTSIRHIESGSEITAANAGTAARGHLYCRVVHAA